MKIIYYCYGGTHSSVLAAAIHSGKLSSANTPSKSQIYSLPLYDKVSSNQLGTPFFYGTDEFDNSIYVLGLAGQRNLIKELVLDYLQLFNINTEELMLVASLPYVSIVTKIGGGLSRRLGLVSLGRPIVTRSLQKLYPNYIKLVDRVKSQLNRMEH
ncbi:MAG: DUF3189 family protein [Bacillota bacterium]